jgi:sporulation protein YlmC with PRC-barrel domain
MKSGVTQVNMRETSGRRHVMNFVKGAEVFTATGEKIGTISRIVIDAKTRDVTDLVVERGALFQDEK